MNGMGVFHACRRVIERTKMVKVERASRVGAVETGRDEGESSSALATRRDTSSPAVDTHLYATLAYLTIRPNTAYPS